MTFEQADKLTDRVVDFLLGSGGPYYERNIGNIQRVVLHAIGTGQFTIRISGKTGKVTHFGCWWKVPDEDLDDIIDSFQTDDPIWPSNTVTGDSALIVDGAQKEGSVMAESRRWRRLARPYKRIGWLRIKSDRQKKKVYGG